MINTTGFDQIYFSYTLRIQYCVTPSINAIFGVSGEAGISVRVLNASSVSRCTEVSFSVIICMLGLLFSFHTQRKE